MFLMFLAILCWSGYYVACEYALKLFPPFFITFLRFALLAITLLPFCGWPAMPFRRLLTLSLLLGVGNFGLGLASLGWGLDIPTAIIVGELSIPFSCMFGAMLLGDKLGKWRSFGLVVAMTGTVFIAGTPNASSNFDAFLSMLCASLSWGLANILMKKYKQVKILSFLGGLSLLSAVPLLGLSLAFETGQLETLSRIRWQEAGGVLYLTYIATLGAYGLWYFLLHRYPASQITPVTMVIPFLSLILAWIFFNQQISMQVIIAGLITVLGVAIINLRRPNLAMLGNIRLRRTPKE